MDQIQEICVVGGDQNYVTQYYLEHVGGGILIKKGSLFIKNYWILNKINLINLHATPISVNN